MSSGGPTTPSQIYLLQHTAGMLGPVTELATIEIFPESLNDWDKLAQKLHDACTAMEKFTGRKFLVFQDSSNATRLFILGEWDSVDQHTNEWIPSQENQRLLELLKDDIVKVELTHLDIPNNKLPLEPFLQQDINQENRNTVKPPPLFLVHKILVPVSKQDLFSEACANFQRNKQKTTQEQEDRPVTYRESAAWQIEKHPDGGATYVLFALQSKEAKDQAWMEADIEEFLDQVADLVTMKQDRYHVRLLDLGQV